jgi:hypothetical protein
MNSQSTYSALRNSELGIRRVLIILQLGVTGSSANLASFHFITQRLFNTDDAD